MSETSKTFKVAGIVSDDKGRTKVRYCNDLVGRVKLFSKNASTKRIEFVELPNPMDKVSAIKFLTSHEKFQSPEDQAVLFEALESRESTPKVKKTKVEKVAKVKTSKKNVPSLDSIKARGKKSKASVEDVIAAVTTETTE